MAHEDEDDAEDQGQKHHKVEDAGDQEDGLLIRHSRVALLKANDAEDDRGDQSGQSADAHQADEQHSDQARGQGHPDAAGDFRARADGGGARNRSGGGGIHRGVDETLDEIPLGIKEDDDADFNGKEDERGDD